MRINLIKKIEEKVNFWENYELKLRKQIDNKKFNIILKNYIILNIKYNFLLFLVNIIFIINSLLNIKVVITIIKNNKKISKINLLLKIIDNGLLILFLVYFKLNGFIFFLLIRIILTLFNHFYFLFKNRNKNFNKNLVHLKNEAILRNIKMCINKNKNIKLKLLQINLLLNNNVR